MITTLIIITGILSGLFMAILWIDVPSYFMPAGRAAKVLQEAQQAPAEKVTGARAWAAPLNQPVAKWTPRGMMRGIESDLYWANFIGQFKGWTATQFMSIRAGGTLAALLLGSFLMSDLMLGAIIAAVIWFVVPMNLHSAAEKVRKTIRSELPEFVQLISAPMAAGVSLEEAINRSAQIDNVIGRWVKQQVEASAGRFLLRQLERAAQESRLTELITFTVQLEFVSKGANQQMLMGMLSTMMAQEFVGKANERAQSISTDLTMQAGIFFFVPFMALILILIGGPMVSSLFL